MNSSFLLFVHYLLNISIVSFLLVYGKRSDKEALCRIIAIVIVVFSLLGGRLLAVEEDFCDPQENIHVETGSDAQRNSDDLLARSAKLVNCAMLSLMPGMLLAVLIVFNHRHNSAYKKARMSLSRPLVRGRLLDDVPHVRQVYNRLSYDPNDHEFIR